jgi:sec-independent protein translocase protein TatB
VFSNLSWYEIVALLLLALFIFGDKLPRMVSEGLRMLRNLRRMAQNATGDLSRELGTDIQLDDLNPRSFLRKHLISEADQEQLLQPLKGVSDDLIRHTRGVEWDLKQVSRDAEQAAGEVRQTASWKGGSAPAAPPATAPSATAPPQLARPGLDDVT